MAKQVEELIQVVMKEQATFGTAETTFDADDVVEVQAGATLSFDPAVRNTKYVGSGFGQGQSVIGPKEMTPSMTFDFRSGGALDEPGDIAKGLKASGFKESVASGVYSYELTSKQSEYTDYTMWFLSGNLDTSGAIVDKAQNVMGSSKISLDFSQAVATLQFEGKGALAALPVAGSQVAKTPSAVPVAPLAGCTINIFDETAYIPVTIEFDLGAEAKPLLNPSDSVSGLGLTLFTKREGKWSAKIYVDSSAIPHSKLTQGAIGTISIAWGAGSNRFTVATTKAQITEIKSSSQDGIQTYDISGPLIDNDLTVTINTNAS